MSGAARTTAPTMVARAHRRGGAGPPLVYVPGIDGSGELLLSTAARLEERFDLLRLRYETTGPVPDGGDRYEDLARSLARVLDDEGIERPLLVAESFGVALALHLALDAPERVRGLALVNGFARYPHRSRLALSRAFLPLVPRPVFRLARHVGSPRVLFGPRLGPSVAAEFRSAQLVQFGGGYLRRLEMIRSVDLLPRLHEVRAPTHVYASDRDRIVDSERAGRAMAERIPDARMTVLARAGHVVLPLAEERWPERLAELLERCG